jgi:beta-aspartyl-dipeptidase (metallo-type)
MTPRLLLIHDAELFAPQPLGRRDVVVAGGRVLAIGRDFQLGSLPHQRLDAAGRWLWPGYVDGLVHISGGGGEGGFATRTLPLAAETALRAGVTTVVGALGTDDVTRSHADLLACARALQAQGVSAYTLTGSYHVPVTTLTGSIRSDLVLIPEMIGVGEIAIADRRGAQPSADELARIAADANVGGLLAGKAGIVLVHLGDEDAALSPLEEASRRHAVARTRWLPTHINRSRRLLELGCAWSRDGGWIDLTTSTTPALVATGDMYGGESLAIALRQGAAGERITMSSDGQASLPLFDAAGRFLELGVAPVGSLHDEVVKAIDEHQVPLALALASATLNPATIWCLPQKGRIAVGTDADLLLLDPTSRAITQTITAGELRLPP